MAKQNLLLFCALVLVNLVVNAQEIPCTVEEHYQQLRRSHPLTSTQAPVKPADHAARKTSSYPDTATYTLPVVVHLIHDYGTENLPDDTVFSWVKQWNDVYNKRNADTIDVISPFVPYVGNAKIRLKLATVDPYGQPTKGIDRLQSYLTVNGDDQAKFHQWRPDMYVNIWLVNRITGGTAYAYFPYMVYSTVYGEYDGPISYATQANNDKVLPHELGHYLNLHHIWGDITCGTSCSGSDTVDDTPPTKGHLFPGCTPAALYDTTCATGYLVHYTDIHGADSIADYPDTTNSQNIMDYTGCSRMFTKGQAARMRAALNSPVGYRDNLITPTTAAATGVLLPMPDLPPVADYIVGGAVPQQRNYFLGLNAPVGFQFDNFSWNDTISSVYWTFSNGAVNPTWSSMLGVTNYFTTPGWVTVSLKATSNAGSNTLVNNHAVYVGDTVAAGRPGYSQDFASPTAISNWPMFNYYNNQFRWQFYSGTGLGDNSCIRYHSFDTSSTTIYARMTGTASGDFDELFTPAFDLSGNGKVYLNFQTSGASTTTGIYATYPPIEDDTLRVYSTTNGGFSWTKIAEYGSTDLANNGDHPADFTPISDDQWVARTINIPTTARNNKTFFRFRYFPGNGGNNLYLDKFNISFLPSGVMEALAATNTMTIFPNPASNGCSLVFKTGSSGRISYCIKDLTGKLVGRYDKQLPSNSLEEELIPRSVTPVAGMYFVTLTVEGVNTTQKLVIY